MNGKQDSSSIVNRSSEPPLKSFPTKQLLIYWAVQIGLGLLLSILNLENSQWLKDLLIYLENSLPTFRTGFVQSATPVASKLFLAIWWVVILPWGLMFSCRWTQGFKPHPNGLKMNYTALLGLLATALLTGYMLGALLSFHDYSYYWMVDKQNSPSRGDVVPALMTNGPFALSIWVAASSFVFVMALTMVPYVLRVVFKKLTEVI
jgi:hypothetical protein